MRSPEAVIKASLQLKGYLKATADEGLKFQVGEKEHPVLTVFTDASFAQTRRSHMDPSSSCWGALQSSGDQDVKDS